MAFRLLLLATTIMQSTINSIEDGVKSYRGYQVWQADVSQKNVSEDFIDGLSERDVWKWGRDSIDIFISANDTGNLDRFLRSYNISYKVISEDVQENIEKENMMRNGRRFSSRVFNERRPDGCLPVVPTIGRQEEPLPQKSKWSYISLIYTGGHMTFTSYPTLKEIYDYLLDIRRANPKYCSLTTIGTTANSQPIRMITISNHNPTNLAMLVDGGMHAREWTGVMSVMYLIEQLAWNFTRQPESVQSKTWYIIPVLNPDGYVYSMTKDRFWRKNFRRFSGPCDGVDVNRNFPYGWGLKGSSKTICSIVFCGITKFSEAESQALRELVEHIRLLAYVSIHSYGNKVVYPYALNGKQTVDVNTQQFVGNEMTKVMSNDAETYVSGTATQVHMVTAGGLAIDWMYFYHGIAHSYIIETRGGAMNGFVLIAEEILPAVKEVYKGILKMCEVAKPLV